MVRKAGISIIFIVCAMASSVAQGSRLGDILTDMAQEQAATAEKASKAAHAAEREKAINRQKEIERQQKSLKQNRENMTKKLVALGVESRKARELVYRFGIKRVTENAKYAVKQINRNKKTKNGAALIVDAIQKDSVNTHTDGVVSLEINQFINKHNQLLNDKNIMYLSFTISNNTKYKKNKFRITCKHYTKDGVRVGKNAIMIRDEIIHPGSSISFEGYNMGFINPKANKTLCDVRTQ